MISRGHDPKTGQPILPAPLLRLRVLLDRRMRMIRLCIHPHLLISIPMKEPVGKGSQNIPPTVTPSSPILLTSASLNHMTSVTSCVLVKCHGTIESETSLMGPSCTIRHIQTRQIDTVRSKTTLLLVNKTTNATSTLIKCSLLHRMIRLMGCIVLLIAVPTLALLVPIRGF